MAFWIYVTFEDLSISFYISSFLCTDIQIFFMFGYTGSQSRPKFPFQMHRIIDHEFYSLYCLENSPFT